MRHRLSFLIVLAATLDLGCASSAAPAGAVEASASLPSVPVVTLEGAPTDLRSVLRGRVAIVSLWATWCDVCVGEIEALKRLQAQASSRGDAVVVGVAVGERRGTVAAFARMRGLAYPQVVDEDFRLADALGEQRVPTTLVINRGGRIVFRGGALDHAGLAAFRTALDAAQ
jgi:cytochrome c biogenesis protein CcmG/thiol:disulfide interchange protein DsbE